MGQRQSKDELLYQQVNRGNVDGVKSLRREGAGLEWKDSEGKTPLIVASMKSELFNVAKALIELGANVNACGPGRHAGTPLHHAARKGLEQTVKLLLSHGADALVMNDDCQTPLDVARAQGCSNVVRAIEAQICLFSGWLRELHGPGFLELLAPQLLSRKVWVVIVPCGSINRLKPFKLELAIYAGAQDAQPRTIVPLWKAKLEEPNFNMPDPAAIISDVSRIPKRWKRKRAIKSSQEARRRTRIKFVPITESEKHQLQWFCNACKGIPQVVHPLFSNQFSTASTTAPAASGDEELVMAINASLHSASNERPPTPVNPYLGMSSGTSSIQETASSGSCPAQLPQTMPQVPSPVSLPSAPPYETAAVEDGPIHYPSIVTGTVDISIGANEKREDSGSPSSCTICLDAPLEGACIPCGHLAGCMSCLNEVMAKKWGCPVCRANIDQIIRIYAV